MTTLDALQESSKKSSIFSLLNPPDSPLPYSPVVDGGGEVNQSHLHPQGAIAFGHAYPLRKADWGNDRSYSMDDYDQHSHYGSFHQSSRMTPSHSPNSYYDQNYHYPERHIIRSDRVEDRYFPNSHQWHQQAYSGPCQYETPAPPVSYSDASNGEITLI